MVSISEIASGLPGLAATRADDGVGVGIKTDVEEIGDGTFGGEAKDKGDRGIPRGPSHSFHAELLRQALTRTLCTAMKRLKVEAALEVLADGSVHLQPVVLSTTSSASTTADEPAVALRSNLMEKEAAVLHGHDTTARQSTSSVEPINVDHATDLTMSEFASDSVTVMSSGALSASHMRNASG